MLIAQISDLHISGRHQKTCGVASMDRHLRKCVASINGLGRRPDIALISGDVTHSFAKEEAEYAADILSGLAMPFVVVPGNHDDRQVLADVFGPDRFRLNADGFADYVVEGYPLRIIALDTLDVGKPGGRIDVARLDWLRARLDEDVSRPTVLVAHHPPLNLGVPETDEDGFVGAKALGELIAIYSNIERFLCGHIHLYTNTRWCGTMVTTAPSIGMQLTLDLSQQSASKFLLSDPAYLLHYWTSDHALVTHQIQLSEMAGPFSFSG